MSGGSRNTVTLEQLVALNDEIAALVRAGVPLEAGLVDATHATPAGGDAIAVALAGRLRSGESLSAALYGERDRIPPVYRKVVEAGIRAGRLSVALESLASYSRELLELRRQIGAALIYPVIVCAVSYGLFLVFMIDLVERFRETYVTFRLPIHGPLSVLIWFSERITYWWWIPPVLLLLGVIWWRTTRSANSLSASGGLASLHWIPGVHEIARLLQYANFADLLALLIEHEVPLGEGLRLAADTTADQRLQRAACRLAETVERGESTGTAILPENRDLPPFLSWVLNQGGRGSNPVRLLRHAAGFYRRRAMTATNWFKVLFPLLTPLILAPTITFIYLLSLFGPLAVFWKDLGVD